MTDWEQRWVEGDTPWDKGAPAPPLLEFLNGPHAGLLNGAQILVPGCGSGHDVRALAEKDTRPVGLDLSETALQKAQEYEKIGGESYMLGDFLTMNDSQYDAIWEHTCFCAIDPSRRQDYAEAAARLVRPGGHLVGVFFLNPWDEGEEENGPPFGASREEIEKLFAPWFTLRHKKVPETSYTGREGREWLACFERQS